MRSDPVAPVITGNNTTRNRSTRPLRSSDWHKLRLPIVLSRPEPSSFIARTASTASTRTSVLLAQVSGSSSEDENTTFDALVSPPTDASSSALNSSVPSGILPTAKPDISRYVFAPIRYVTSGCSASHARYSGPCKPHQPGQPSPDAQPSSEVMKSTSNSRTAAPLFVMQLHSGSGQLSDDRRECVGNLGARRRSRRSRAPPDAA